MKRRELCVGSLLLGAGILPVQAKIASNLAVPPIKELQINEKPFYPFIELTGDARTGGRIYGEKAKEAIARNIAFYSGFFKNSAGVSWDKAQELSTRFLPVIEKYSPDAIEEMKGVAEGSGRTFHEILTLNCRSEVLFAKADACSCVIIPSEQGEGGDVFMGQTWDWLSSAVGNSVVLKIVKENSPTILMICEAGLIGGKGLNSEGLGICLNATSVGKGRVGMPLHLMMRNVLEAGLPTEAIKAVSSVPRAGSGTFNIAARNNYEMIIEFSPDTFDVIMSSGEPLIHTNHYLSPLLRDKDAAKSFIPSTFTRFNTMEKYLKAHKEKIGEKGLFRLLSNHDNYPESVCYHADPRLSGDRYLSVYAMVMNVNKGILWVSDGYSCEGKVSEYRL